MAMYCLYPQSDRSTIGKKTILPILFKNGMQNFHLQAILDDLKELPGRIFTKVIITRMTIRRLGMLVMRFLKELSQWLKGNSSYFIHELTPKSPLLRIREGT
jgi:hypothetical protein